MSKPLVTSLSYLFEITLPISLAVGDLLREVPHRVQYSGIPGLQLLQHFVTCQLSQGGIALQGHGGQGRSLLLEVDAESKKQKCVIRFVAGVILSYRLEESIGRGSLVWRI